ncbi:MAG TPA: DUF4019 domain-containing protein [Xanthomonadales bacterium]|nr:DUF4019 domain-containing protein [Xanthomonadales bacterium]
MRIIVFLAAVLLALPRLAFAAYQPTEAESQEVATLTAKYFALVDDMKYDETYAMLAPSLTAQVSAGEWSTLQRDARAERGAPRERVQRLLSWEADPDGVPAGLYVAVDLDSVHAEAKHMSEYVVWYRAPGSKAFRLLRHETTEMRGIAEGAGGPSPHAGVAPKDEKDIFAARETAPAATPTPAATSAFAHPSPHAAQPGPLPPVAPPTLFASEAEPIGFKTVAEARAALAKRDGASATTDEFGWTVVSEDRTQALWSFVPGKHPAFPAVVRRQLVERDGTIFIEMETLCEAKQAACDALEREFEALNARAKADIEASQRPATKS